MPRARYSGTNIDAFYSSPRAPGSFSSVRNLQRYSGRTVSEGRKFIAGRDAYTMHKPRRIRFPRRRTFSKGIADFYQIDLADVSNLSPFNDGMRYLLTCIDVFSKRAWAIPIKTKSARSVADAFEKILSEGTCNMVQSDKGTEFLNFTFQSMLRRHGIHFYTSENVDLEASVVERFNRTLKTWMYRYFTHATIRGRVGQSCAHVQQHVLPVNRDGSGGSRYAQRERRQSSSVSAEVEMLQVEVSNRRQSAHGDAATTVPQRVPGRLVGGNIPGCIATTYATCDVRSQKSERRAYKRQVSNRNFKRY